MPLRDTLVRVDADLAAGRVPLARQRLRGLVASFPHDLTLRRRLAEVYRLYGEPAEAGRWMYLEEDRDTDETTAFEERYASPGRRMRALAWPAPEATAATAATAFAEAELAALRTACALEEEKNDGETPPAPWTVREALAGAGCLVAAVAFLAVWVNGLVALFD